MVQRKHPMQDYHPKSCMAERCRRLVLLPRHKFQYTKKAEQESCRPFLCLYRHADWGIRGEDGVRFHKGRTASLCLAVLVILLEEEIVVRIFLHVKLAHAAVDEILQFVDVLALTGGDEDAVVAEAGHPSFLQLAEREVFARGRREVVGLFFHPGVGVHFVEHHNLRFVGTAEVAERFVDHFHLFFKVGVRHVDHVNQEVGLTHFVEGAFEGLHQVGGQFADKTDSVGQEEGKIFDDDLAHRCVERGEEFVFGKHLCLCQEVDER